MPFGAEHGTVCRTHWVTAGIDFGLRAAAEPRGREEAEGKGVQLMLEYDPAPPFDAGSPAGAAARLAG